MAAEFFLRFIVLVQLVLACSGQYNDYGAYYNYGYDYGYDSSWCPFGINGMCQCENDIVNCTSQGLSSVPLDLPATTKQLILKDNRITSVGFMPLALYTGLEHLDLSSNSLETLPDGVFEALSTLKTINLSDNPWRCDCNLKWLSIWVLTAADSNIQILDSASTNCVAWPALSILDLLPVDFCSSEAGSCVLSHDTHNVAVVTYSFFASMQNSAECQNHCFTHNYTFHAFQNSRNQCLCGEENKTAQCSDCNSNTVSSANLTLCSGAYMRVTGASHVLSNVDLSFTSPVVTHAPIRFTLSGFPNSISSFSWNFGDGARRDNTSLAVISHSYFYPGLFPVSVDLCGSGVCRTVQVQVKVAAESVQATLNCPALSEVSSKIILNTTLSNSYGMSVKWSRTTTAGTVHGVKGSGGCETGWTDFADRCVKHFKRTKTFDQAEQLCQGRGGTLFRLNHLAEEQQIITLLGISAGDTMWVGAKYNGSVYQWHSTGVPAYFLRALYIDRSAGDCLVLSANGLVSANCSIDYSILCQSDPKPCPRGQMLGPSGHCFFLEPSGESWQQARQACQGYYSGDLAVLSDQTVRSIVLPTLNVTSPAWIGLSAPDLLGHFSWADGESLSGNNWVSSNWQTGVRWPCASVTASGQWDPTACNHSLPYICQYSLDDVVNSDLHVAGTADLQNNGNSFQILNEYTQSLPQQAVQTVVMPGLWFAKAGQLLEVNMHVESQSSNTIVAVQVMRPTCHGNYVIFPGCEQNMFAKCGTQAQHYGCPVPPPCSSPMQHVCPLTQTCISSSTPCSCAAISSGNPSCSNSDPAADLTYTVVGKAVYEIPAAGGSFTAKIVGGIAVQPYDVLALQSSRLHNSTLGLCHTDAASQWRQVAFLTNSSSWTNSSQEVSLTSFGKQENFVCRVNILYGSPQTVSLPNKLAYVAAPMTYSFQATVTGSQTLNQVCTVQAVQGVGNLDWLHPSLTHINTNPTVFVEAGVIQEFVVSVASGSDLQVVWELDNGRRSTGRATAACPSSVPSHIGQCIEPDSQLPYPFLIFEDTFSSAASVTLTLNVSNSLGWKNQTVTVTAVEPIQNLVLSHPSCSGNTPCSPLVEVGVPQQFFVSKTSGTVDQYEFRENGTVVQTLQSPNFTRNYSAPGLYRMAVSATNGMESKDATLDVNAKVRAQASQIVLSPSGSISVEVGKSAKFAVIATIAPELSVSLSAALVAKTVVAPDSELTISWTYGDGLTDSASGQVTGNTFTADKNHTYQLAGSYPLLITVQDAFGVEVNTTATVNVLSPIPNVQLSVSSPVVAAGNASSFTATIQPTPPSAIFGSLTYTFNFNDGSAAINVTSTMPSMTVDYAFSVNGTYRVDVSVKNEISSVTGNNTVIVQECPSRVRLSYNGPRNLSEQLTFTVSVTNGSDLHYSFNFGDGVSLHNQSSPITLHTYNKSGTYNMSVVVSNDVCSVYDSENVIAMDSSTLVVRKISHDRFVPTYMYVPFTVDVVTLDMQKLDLVWTNGNMTLPALRATKKVNLSFHTVGNHTVSVVLTLDNGVTKTATTTVFVQERVSNVTMTGPHMVSYTQNQPAMEAFRANTLNGTDVNFDWYNNSVKVAQGANINLTMDTAGVFNISAVAHNEVSQGRAWQLVTVLHAVENVVISCLSCIHNRFMASGKQASFECTYLGTNATVSWRTYRTSDNGSQFNHTYFIPGTNTVEVSVFNLNSRMNATLDILVEDEISSLNVIPDRSPIRENSSVQLSAVHAKGMNVEYSWQCGSQTAQLTSVNTTQWTFLTWGLYSCNVTATNNVSFQQTSINITVLQTITTLGVKNLPANSTLYVPVNKNPSVEVDCNTDFGVNFTWIIMKAGAVVATRSGPTLSYVFGHVDDYELSLEAVNAVSKRNTTVQVKTLEEITGVNVTSNTTAMKVGAGVELMANIASGTSPYYQWSLNNISMTAVNNFSHFTYTFTSADTYIIEVLVSNRVSSQTANLSILVQYPVRNITVNTSLNFQHPFVSQNQNIAFRASVSQGSDPRFKWTVQSPSLSQVNTPGDYLPLNFTETGEYSIQLVVSNTVSDISRNFTVYVEKAITSLNLKTLTTLNLTVGTSTVVATGDSVGLQAEPNSDATPVTYIWTVEGQNYSVQSFMHSFMSPGIYVIRLVAENNISRIEQSRTVQVEEPLTALQMADCNVTRRAGVPTSLSATAQGTNVSFSWAVQLPSGNRSEVAPS